MPYRAYIKKYASKIDDGKFYCGLCDKWIDNQRWIHFKYFHRFEKTKKNSLKNENKQ